LGLAFFCEVLDWKVKWVKWKVNVLKWKVNRSKWKVNVLKWKVNSPPVGIKNDPKVKNIFL
jgi:hypothetical protein